jgi:hypothetical protein
MKRSKLAALLLVSALIACFFSAHMNLQTPSGSNAAGTVKITRVDQSSVISGTGMNRAEDRRPVSIDDRKRECPNGISMTGSRARSEQPEAAIDNLELGDNGPRPRISTDADSSDSVRKTDGEPDSRCDSGAESGNSTGSGRKVQEDGMEQESWIRIVRISVPEQYAEDTEIVMPRDNPSAPMAFFGGFYLEGNDVKIPCCLLIRTRDAAGKELIQYLPWNPNHPNDFQALSPMRGYASIAVYDGPRLMGRFYVTEFSGEEKISLDLNAGQDRRLASL